MSDVRFYHLERQTVAEALPALLSKVLEAGLQAVVKCRSDEQLKEIDKALWSWKPESFLAHGSNGCILPEKQPIFLTLKDDNPAAATILVLLDNAEPASMDGYDRILYMFSGLDEEIIVNARNDWKKYKELADVTSYWQQPPGGGWEQKA